MLTITGNDASMFVITSESSDASEVFNKKNKKLVHPKNSFSFKRLKTTANEEKTINGNFID